MNILIAMDSMKGSIPSNHANQAIAQGLLEADPSFKIATLPIADGGEGTVEALVQATNGTYREAVFTGPLGEPVTATYGILGISNTAVIEVAEACGLPLIKEEDLNPLEATSYGVGELILEASRLGCDQFIVGLGGSATVDGGLGMLQALGFQFLNEDGQEILETGGKALGKINRMDDSKVDPLIKKSRFQVACDVTNPIYGEQGAAYVFGPQKGATEEDVKVLDEGLRNFARVVSEERQIDLQEIPGTGAAGGLGGAFVGFLQVELVPGVDLLLETVELEKKLKQIDLVITGEGKLDFQTEMGKAPAGIAKTAKKRDIPVIGIAGDVSNANPKLHDIGIDAYFSIVAGPISLEKSMMEDVTRENLQRTGEQLGRLIKLKFD